MHEAGLLTKLADRVVGFEEKQGVAINTRLKKIILYQFLQIMTFLSFLFLNTKPNSYLLIEYYDLGENCNSFE